MKTRNSFYLIVLSFLTASCGLNNDRGELTGVPGRRPWFHPQPFGTVYVPTGSFHVGLDDQDVLSSHLAPNKQVSVVAFYMDQTEITNNEYRQFVYHVVDSIARETIGDQYLIEHEDGTTSIDYDLRLDWDDPENADYLTDMFYPENERYYRKKTLDVRKLNFTYSWIDIKNAAKQPNKGYDANRADFIVENTINVYPDTLTFVRDYTYSFNEPMTQMYFWHPKYDDYPVVGVTWEQANAFCIWRTRHLNSYYELIGEPIVNPFRLPTEYEWEYASRGGRDGSMYPWGGPYVRNTKGCFLANFKPGRGDYPADGGFYPIRTGSYFPNDYGLYDMSGNVAEWTKTAYAESGNFFTDDMNPDYQFDGTDQTETLKRKTIRGGSWKDISFYIRNGARAYEYQDTAKSFLGFRCVMTYVGRSNKDTK